MSRPHGAAPVRRRRGAVPAAVLGVLLTVVVLGAAYLVGRTVVGPFTEGGEKGVPVSVWTSTHAVMHADAASADGLRAEGWTLPTLASDGYQVASMVRSTRSGQPVVSIALQRGEDDAVHVVEQRGRIDRQNPMDGVTGLPVSAGSLEPTAVAGVPLWTAAGPPWRAVLVGNGVVYTVTADSGPPEMAHLMNLVAAAERGRVVEPTVEDPGPAATVVAGLREIFG